MDQLISQKQFFIITIIIKAKSVTYPLQQQLFWVTTFYLTQIISPQLHLIGCANISYKNGKNCMGPSRAQKPTLLYSLYKNLWLSTVIRNICTVLMNVVEKIYFVLFLSVRVTFMLCQAGIF